MTDLLNPQKPAPTTIGNFDMTDNDKATEIAESFFKELRHSQKYRGDTSDADFEAQGTEYLADKIKAAIESQRLALEEKDEHIKNLENNWSVKTSFQCHCNTTKDDGFCAACSLSFAEEALEEKDKQIASRDGLIKNLSAEIAEMVPKNEKLQAKVIEMETAINNYGRHLAYCGVHNHIVPEAKYCNCGLTDYLIARS